MLSFAGNIHDIRVPVPGTSAGEFEVRETGKRKKGEDKNINWNLQVLGIYLDRHNDQFGGWGVGKYSPL